MAAEGLSFRKSGVGPALIFLHGFPMHRRVWDDFISFFEASYTVYTPDLPGLGNSAPLTGDFTLEDVGDRVLHWVAQNGLEGAVVVGHSMGGYVALAMARKRPASFRGLVLFHSTALADSAEKKESRSKVIRFIAENGVLAFTSGFIAPLFADAQHPAIPFVKGITIEAGADAVAGYTRAMRDRPDSTEVLGNFGRPVLIIAGDRDAGIPVSSVNSQASPFENVFVHVLEDTGHMGMFEKKEEAQRVIHAFLFKIFDPSL